MTHLPSLIQDLGFILIVAGITTIVFKLLKQPVVLGYLIAGLIVGPNIRLTPTITEEASIHIWAEIGIIVLLFSLGLEFSFKKLAKVGGPSSLTALMEIGTMLFAGYMLGKAFGMSQMDCLFLSGIMSISSTTIILRTFDELGLKAKNFAQVVMGVLIIEDLLAILILVMLSTIAVTVNIESTQILVSILKLIFFLVFWFVCGIYFMPTIFRKTKKLMNDETLLVVSLGLCLVMVIITTKLGFSASLGAFLMGSILAETPQAERIEHIIKPVKELFGAIFFVSVGMLIDPKMILENWVLVLIISAMVIIIKPLGAIIGAVLSGQPLKQSMQVGMTVSQIGEFSFIIATLGISLKATSSFLYPVAVAVSAITTFTTPFMISAAPRIFGMVDRMLPKRIKLLLAKYSAGTQAIKTESLWKLYLQDFFLKVLVYTVILTAIILISSGLVLPAITENPDEMNWKTISTALITLAAMVPFLWALATRKGNRKAFEEFGRNRRNRGPIAVMYLARIALALFLLGFYVNSFFSRSTALITFLVLIFSLVLFRKRIQRYYSRIENRFLFNFNNTESAPASPGKLLTPWDAHIVHFTVDPSASFAGRKLKDLQFREQFGINIAQISRGELKIPVPQREERIFPNDDISVIGTDAQIEQFKKYLDEQKAPVTTPEQHPPMGLYSVVIREGNTSWYIGKNIRESGIRERSMGLVVGIERKGRRILNPESTVVIEKDDLLWIVGDETRKKEIIHHGENITA